MSKNIITSQLDEESDFKKRSYNRDRKLRKFKASSCLAPDVGFNDLGIQPDYFIPQLENSSLELPRSRHEIVSWCDYYYQTNELIGAAIDTHATLSVSDFSISCKDKKIQQEYEDVLEDINYRELLYEIAHEYFRLGNAFPMGNFDEDNKSWSEFVLLPMVNIELQKSILHREAKILLVVDDHLRNLSNTNDPFLKSEYDLLPNDVKECIKNNLPILLAPNRVTHISNRSIAGTLWGSPPVFRCFKTLVYDSKLFRAQESIADNQITPLKMFSLITQDGLPVSDEEAESFREELINASFDPNYFIVTSGQVKDNYVGSSGKILPMNSEMDMIERKISSGMRVSKAILHGEGPTYANAQVYQQTMTFYYYAFRNKLKNWLINKVFKVIAETRGYYDSKNLESGKLNYSSVQKRLILPEIIFRGTGFVDSQSMSYIDRLNSNKKISDETYISMLLPDIEYEQEKIRINRQETENIVRDKVAPEIQERLDTPQATSIEDSKTEEELDLKKKDL